MQSFWGRFVGSLLALGVTLTVSVGFDVANPSDGVINSIPYLIVILVTVGLVEGIYWLRGRDSRARRARLNSMTGVRWIADVTIDSGTLEVLLRESVTPAGTTPPAQNYALVVAASTIEFWGPPSAELPVASVALSRLRDAEEFPYAGTAYGAGEFWIVLTTDETLSFGVVNPALFGVYPATPKQVTKVVEALSDPVEASRGMQNDAATA